MEKEKNYMKKTRKIAAVVLAIGMAALVPLTGCNPFFEPLPQYESEYWRYAVETEKDGTKKAYLIGFTELGQEQSTLVVPEKIDGIKTCQFGYIESGRSMWSNYPVGEFISEKLERLYIPFIKNENWNQSNTAVGDYNMPNCYLVYWKKIESFNLRIQKYIIGYNLLNDVLTNLKNNGIKDYSNHLLANISYLYNYKNSIDDGYYWVDSYDNSVIKFIPPEPTRAGYTFGGWYKEAECIHAWDFSTDITGEQIVLDAEKTFEDYNPEDITFLYAKWNEK
jgi:uncharacterized repeat protein (TIGR02543 family)